MGKIMISVAVLLLFLSGCSEGDKYDKIQAVDGKGRIFLFTHNLGDTYFLQVLNDGPVTETETEKINAELARKISENTGKAKD